MRNMINGVIWNEEKKKSEIKSKVLMNQNRKIHYNIGFSTNHEIKGPLKIIYFCYKNKLKN